MSKGQNKKGLCRALYGIWVSPTGKQEVLKETKQGRKMILFAY
jgi:hypothetical protein